MRAAVKAFKGGPVGPTLSGTSTASVNGAGPIVVTIPAATKVGDLILLAVGSGSLATTPAGWTLVTSQTNVAAHLALFSKVAAVGDPGNTVSVSGLTDFTLAHCRSYTTHGIDTFAGSTGGTPTNVPPEIMTPTHGNEWEVTFLNSVNVQSGTRSFSFGSGGFHELEIDGINNNCGTLLSQDAPCNGTGAQAAGATMTINSQNYSTEISVLLIAPP